MTFRTLLSVFFPEADNFLTKDFVGASHQNVRGLSFPGTSTESRKRHGNSYFQGFFIFFLITTGNINHIIPLCLLLRKDKLESHESPHSLPARVSEKLVKKQ